MIRESSKHALLELTRECVAAMRDIRVSIPPAGYDLAFIEASETGHEVRTIIGRFGLPHHEVLVATCLVNFTPQGKWDNAQCTLTLEGDSEWAPRVFDCHMTGHDVHMVPIEVIRRYQIISRIIQRELSALGDTAQAAAIRLRELGCPPSAGGVRTLLDYLVAPNFELEFDHEDRQWTIWPTPSERQLKFVPGIPVPQAVQDMINQQLRA